MIQLFKVEKMHRTVTSINMEVAEIYEWLPIGLPRIMKSDHPFIGLISPVALGRFLVFSLDNAGRNYGAVNAEGVILSWTVEKLGQGTFYAFATAWDRLHWMMEGEAGATQAH